MKVQNGISNSAECTAWWGPSHIKKILMCFVPSITSFLPAGVQIVLKESMHILKHTSRKFSGEIF
jgi:hypothetical protein